MPGRGRANPRRGISVSSRRGWGLGASENVAVLRRSTMMYRFIAGAVLLGLTLLASPARAQTATGTILGEIKDSTGGAFPGVTVTTINQSNGAPSAAVTDPAGSYNFFTPPPPGYTIEGALPRVFPT